jgi:hypothetical protein
MFKLTNNSYYYLKNKLLLFLDFSKHCLLLTSSIWPDLRLLVYRIRGRRRLILQAYHTCECYKLNYSTTNTRLCYKYNAVHKKMNTTRTRCNLSLHNIKNLLKFAETRVRANQLRSWYIILTYILTTLS